MIDFNEFRGPGCRIVEGRGFVNAQLPWHQAALDSHGRLLTWYPPEEILDYDKVPRLGWNFLEHKVPGNPKTRLKIYLINSLFSSKTLLGVNWNRNPAMLYGSMADSLVPGIPARLANRRSGIA